LTFKNELGQTSSGAFTSSNQVIATNWGNLMGTLVSNDTQINWSNGTVWTLAPAGNVPNIAGDWMVNNQATTISQSGASLTFKNERGQVSAGQFLSTGTQVMATGWGNLVGTLTNNDTEIDWANGTVWTFG